MSARGSQTIRVQPRSLKSGAVHLGSRDCPPSAGTVRKTNCARALLLSTLTSNLLPLPCFLTSPLRDGIVQHLRASKKAHLFSCVKPSPLSYISASAPRLPPNPRPLPKISEPQCLSLPAIKPQIPAF